MPVKVQCGECFTSFRVREDLAGKTVRCKECGSAVRVDLPGASRRKRKERSHAPSDSTDDDHEDLDADLSPVRKAKSKSKERSGFSVGRFVRSVYDTPWSFFVVAISVGLVPLALLPERFQVNKHLIVIREAPIAVAYLVAGMIWYLAIGGYSDRKQMTFFENYMANIKLKLQIFPILGLIFGVVQLENLLGKIVCGVALIVIVVWKSRELKPNEWRPASLMLIGLGFLIPTMTSIVQSFRH